MKSVYCLGLTQLLTWRRFQREVSDRITINQEVAIHKFAISTLTGHYWGQVITFPKEPRSEFEQAIRKGIAEGADGRLPAATIDQVAKNVVVAAEQWQAGSLALSYKVPGHFSPEVVQEIERIASLVANETKMWVYGKVIAERTAFEIKLALAGWTVTGK